MKFSTTLKGAAAAAVIGGLAVTTAGAASASTTTARQAKPVEAITKIVNRADNGGGGNPWAYDSFTRDLKVFYLGKSTDPNMTATPYMYWAKITDIGTFRDMPGQLTPNQGGQNAGKVLRPGQVSGPMTGSGQWGVFYASAKAHNGLAPTVLRGVKLNAVYSSSSWPELAFPQGTTFSGLSESSYDYNYQAVPFTKYVVKTVNGKRVIVKVTGFRQHWEDAWFNGDGQLPRDGNILGVR